MSDEWKCWEPGQQIKLVRGVTTSLSNATILKGSILTILEVRPNEPIDSYPVRVKSANKTTFWIKPNDDFELVPIVSTDLTLESLENSLKMYVVAKDQAGVSFVIKCLEAFKLLKELKENSL